MRDRPSTSFTTHVWSVRRYPVRHQSARLYSTFGHNLGGGSILLPPFVHCCSLFLAATRMLTQCANIFSGDPGNGFRDDDTERQEIDNEIRALQDSIRALRTRRNTLAPINRFPPEILANVFAYSLPKIYPRPDPSKENDEPYNWIAVTHVSRHWRNVALDNPILWSVLQFQVVRWVHEMVRRSGNTPLFIYLERDCNRTDERSGGLRARKSRSHT